jgi:hypothetical protein
MHTKWVPFVIREEFYVLQELEYRASSTVTACVRVTVTLSLCIIHHDAKTTWEWGIAPRSHNFVTGGG